ncbi:hypothetical protein HPB50_018985 [Hyalomma asiaticum]|uniref:Uncharacterized protein n=1 Tax=Hyalomma asiaticum TaxID=266040 RepID=A0ACB7RIT6_HYAAI|nr:hypothetical protein HPB50_018985 [Hyalomma asiaticum]
MRWIKFDTSVNGIFSREVCPEDSEYLQTHSDTFKCMWHEQTRNYWVRMVISLREYVRKHIFTYESLMLIEYSYINICSNFTQDTYGKAKDFLTSIIYVAANKDMMCQIGSRPLSNDPFYNKFSRDHFRNVFGQPNNSAAKKQLQVYIIAPLYSRFAAAVVAVLKQWIQATDCSLKDYYQKFHSKPYWPYPDDFCPQKIFFKYVDENCYGWESPDPEEVDAVMLRAPDRATEFVDVVPLLPSEFMNYEDESDSCSEHSSDSDGQHGIKNWSDIMFAVSDQLLYNCPFHVKQLCGTCMANASDSDGEGNSGKDSCNDSGNSVDDYDTAQEDYDFWHHPRVCGDLLIHIGLRTCFFIVTVSLSAETVALNSQAFRLNKKSRKNPHTAPSSNITSTAKRQQPAFMKHGAIPPPPKSRAEVINFDDDEDKTCKLAAALERLKLKIDGSNGITPTPPEPEKPQEASKPPQKAAASQEKVKSQPQKKAAPLNVEAANKKSSASSATVAAVSKTAQRKCALCSKSEDVKLKKCSL